MIFNRYIIGVLLGAIMLASCHRVTIVLDDIPANTPIGEDIYIVGNFNDWNPGNQDYQMKLNKDSTYSFRIPSGYGNLEYKFTRGSWTTVEKGQCGEETENRFCNVNEDKNIHASIESWADLDPVNCTYRTVCIEMLPGNTPENAIISIASEANSWDPDQESVAHKIKNGKYCLTVERPKGMNKMEFKVTRGDLSNSESDVFGKEVPNRILEFGKKDTLKINVEGWIDLPMDHPEQITLILNSIPKITPKNEDLFLASELNSWKSGDEAYKFEKNEDGKYFINLPRKRMILSYKITREGWKTVEVDQNGYDIDNRWLNLAKADSIYIDVERWKDQDYLGQPDLFIVLTQIPESTPKDDAVFISGNFNDWNPGLLKYRFEKGNDGQYFVKIKRERGNLEFKITRGSWDEEAINSDGSGIPVFRFSYSEFDTIKINNGIDQWKDLPPIKHAENVTIVIDQIPKNTPNNPQIYFASNLNSWDPLNLSYIFNQLPNGNYYITINKTQDPFEYKLTRGGWHTVETDKYGEDIDNRIQYFGFADTVFIQVETWKDLR